MSVQAPGDLRKIQLFVNTWDEEDQREALHSPEALEGFFKEQDLWPGGRSSNTSDLESAVAVREAIRALLVHNHGDPLDPKAVTQINDASKQALFAIEFQPGEAKLSPRADGTVGAIGNLLSIVAAAMNDGTWSRLKICQNDECAVAFYDAARNRSAKWCSMAVCGNRVKARNYRARQQS